MNESDKGYEGDVDEDLTKRVSAVSLSDKIIDNEYKFPRCEYYTRMHSTSIFAMQDTKYFGTYYRSTIRGGESDRYSHILAKKQKTEKKHKKIYKKTYDNSSLNNNKKVTARDAKTGSFNNPLFLDEYKEALLGTLRPEFGPTPPLLYDAVLKYKRKSCQLLMEKCKYVNFKEIVIGYNNNYSCIMVYIPKLEKKLNIESWYAIAMAYFIAHANHEAINAELPIEIVQRSSFGHYIPAVGTTGESFRINIGLIPDKYQEILINALQTLDDTIKELQEAQFTIEDLIFMNPKINSFNEKNNKDKNKNNVDNWEESVWNTLHKKGTSNSNYCVAYELTRKRRYVDILADMISVELSKPSPDLTIPLKKLMLKLDYSRTRVTLSVNDNDFRYLKEKYKFSNDSYKCEDHDFWIIIGDICSSLGVNPISITTDIKGIYAKLEKFNLDFIASKSKEFESKNGIGSDSECDIDIPSNESLHHMKIVTATGMKAINLAVYLSFVYLVKHSKIVKYKISADNMYYETIKAIETINLPPSNSDKNNTLQKERKNSCDASPLLIFDLNHCHSSKKDSRTLEVELKNHKEKMPIILDYTSATTDEINNAVEISMKKTDLVFLVNSGLKNEQAAADINPYGTIRIIGKSQELTQEIYQTASKILTINGDILPKASHQVRMAYKSVRAAISAINIFKNTRHATSDYKKMNINITNEQLKYWEFI